MIGPNILISILEERYRNTSNFLEEGRLPKFGKIHPQGAQTLRRNYNKMVKELGDSEAYSMFVKTYGKKNADALGIKPPAPKPPEPTLFDDIPETPPQQPQTPSNAVEVEVTTTNTKPHAASPTPSPVTPNSATINVDVKRRPPIDFDAAQPDQPMTTTGVEPVETKYPITPYRFPPVTEVPYPPTGTALALYRQKYPLAKRPEEKYPIQKYRFPPVDPPIVDPPPPPRTGEPPRYPTPFPTGFGGDYGVLYSTARGSGIRGDVGLMGDIGGMSRLAHRYKIA